jgi:predicted AAA+ superfamily ATPase
MNTTTIIITADLLISCSLLHAQWTSGELAMKRDNKNCDASSFFERMHERQQLDGILLQAPSAITELLGPRDSGKTALLQNYPLQAEQEQQLARAYMLISIVEERQ